MTTGSPIPVYPARPRRSRVRRFLPLGIAAWLVLEIWILTVVADAAGGLMLFLLLIAGFALGSVVVKRAGRRAFRSLSETLQGRQSGEAAARGDSREGNGLMMLGGLLLMLPGLMTDAVGLLLLIPPLQKALGRYAERTFDRKIREAGAYGLQDAFRQARVRRPDGKTVQGEVIREDEGNAPQGPRPPLNR